jgi:protein-tyrosine phosphatase
VENMKKILCVCTKNGFRSPTAELLSKRFLKGKKIKGISISSAGIKIWDWGFDEEDVKILKSLSEVLKYNYLTRKRTKLNERIVKKSDKIIVFTKSHKDLIEAKYPESRGKIFTITEMTGISEKNFKDLKGKPVKDHIKFYNNLEKLIKKNIKKIVE